MDKYVIKEQKNMHKNQIKIRNRKLLAVSKNIFRVTDLKPMELELRYQMESLTSNLKGVVLYSHNATRAPSSLLG